MVDNDTLGREALRMHAAGRPGKVEVTPTKPLTTQYQLSLAYSPGVAAPCLEIEKDPGLAYDYTAKGNMVAVISNGTAVLGLGNIGALASKPVMEGKAVLFKRFADVDGIDLEVDTEDVDAFIECVRYLGKSFGGINLEDIKAPECFIVEERLRELLDIPVFHDDQHGTAIISAAGLINALHLTGRRIQDCRMVVNGAGASGIACVDLFKALGLPAENVVLCDTRGVIYRGRAEGMNQWKSATPSRRRCARWKRRWRARTSPSASRSRAPSPARWWPPWRRSRSSSRSPIPTRRSRRKRCARCAATPSSAPGGRTTRTRSTMCWASPTSSAARWTCAPRPSTTR